MFNTPMDLYIKYKISTKSYNNELLLEIFNSDELNDDTYDLSNGECLTILGMYYRYKKDNIEQMLKYFLMASELFNLDAMTDLGNYYKSKNDINNTNAMNNIGNYYKSINDIENKAAMANLNNFILNSFFYYYDNSNVYIQKKLI